MLLLHPRDAFVTILWFFHGRKNLCWQNLVKQKSICVIFKLGFIIFFSLFDKKNLNGRNYRKLDKISFKCLSIEQFRKERRNSRKITRQCSWIFDITVTQFRPQFMFHIIFVRLISFFGHSHLGPELFKSPKKIQFI
ncbi:hypothetical protein BpHYR1_015383 [Brachionus plicatilis]|uniref:Uncharacterized protein n=1 Tax=Brachionus plicatilis TaxID=10195 RepID=A0A3M7PEZ4_BRAPC|nr:hypothetical protein BpHYR1_015383 [Brachionus plicatilis]